MIGGDVGYVAAEHGATLAAQQQIKAVAVGLCALVDGSQHSAAARPLGLFAERREIGRNGARDLTAQNGVGLGEHPADEQREHGKQNSHRQQGEPQRRCIQ